MGPLTSWLYASVDVGNNIVAPLVTGALLACLIGLVGWAVRGTRRFYAEQREQSTQIAKLTEAVAKQLEPNGRDHEAGTAGLTARDALAENTRLTRQLHDTLEDHSINDDRRFHEQLQEIARLQGVIDDRGEMVRALLERAFPKAPE